MTERPLLGPLEQRLLSYDDGDVKIAEITAAELPDKADKEISKLVGGLGDKYGNLDEAVRHDEVLKEAPIRATAVRTFSTPAEDPLQTPRTKREKRHRFWRNAQAKHLHRREADLFTVNNGYRESTFDEAALPPLSTMEFASPAARRFEEMRRSKLKGDATTRSTLGSAEHRAQVDAMPRGKNKRHEQKNLRDLDRLEHGARINIPLIRRIPGIGKIRPLSGIHRLEDSLERGAEGHTRAGRRRAAKIDEQETIIENDKARIDEIDKLRYNTILKQELESERERYGELSRLQAELVEARRDGRPADEIAQLELQIRDQRAVISEEDRLSRQRQWNAQLELGEAWADDLMSDPHYVANFRARHAAEDVKAQEDAHEARERQKAADIERLGELSTRLDSMGKEIGIRQAWMLYSTALGAGNIERATEIKQAFMQPLDDRLDLMINSLDQIYREDVETIDNKLAELELEVRPDHTMTPEERVEYRETVDRKRRALNEQKLFIERWHSTQLVNARFLADTEKDRQRVFINELRDTWNSVKLNELQSRLERARRAGRPIEEIIQFEQQIRDQQEFINELRDTWGS